MPIARFEDLPDSSRVWVYGSSEELDPAKVDRLLNAADEFLEGWAAHGAPLTSARNWSDDRFLTIGVDQRQEGASGCSIDGLFRTLKGLEKELGTELVTSGRVYFRDRASRVRSVTRDEFSELAASGEVDGDTEVFDTSVTSLGEWRARFSSRATDSWHSALMSARV
ncbi:MAG TPA: hypothetical protein VM939_01745 [Gemmatimonadaceae bacterium]|nr:hypothetical protein [Gemmatimonadaceae bacterium]